MTRENGPPLKTPGGLSTCAAARTSGSAARGVRAVALAGSLATALAACASSESVGSAGRIELAAGARAEGRVDVPAGAEASLRLARTGPGRVDYTLRREGGATIASGSLNASVTTEIPESDRTETYVLVLSAHEQEAAVNGYLKVSGERSDPAITWTMTR